MHHLILSRTHGQIAFTMPDEGGPITLEAHMKPGVSEATLHEGGHYQGFKLTANFDTFEATCQRWHTQRMKLCKTYGYSYRP